MSLFGTTPFLRNSFGAGLAGGFAPGTPPSPRLAIPGRRLPQSEAPGQDIPAPPPPPPIVNLGNQRVPGVVNPGRGIISDPGPGAPPPYPGDTSPGSSPPTFNPGQIPGRINPGGPPSGGPGGFPPPPFGPGTTPSGPPGFGPGEQSGNYGPGITRRGDTNQGLGQSWDMSGGVTQSPNTPASGLTPPSSIFSPRRPPDDEAFGPGQMGPPAPPAPAPADTWRNTAPSVSDQRRTPTDVNGWPPVSSGRYLGSGGGAARRMGGSPRTWTPWSGMTDPRNNLQNAMGQLSRYWNSLPQPGGGNPAPAGRPQGGWSRYESGGVTYINGVPQFAAPRGGPGTPPGGGGGSAPPPPRGGGSGAPPGGPTPPPRGAPARAGGTMPSMPYFGATAPLRRRQQPSVPTVYDLRQGQGGLGPRASDVSYRPEGSAPPAATPARSPQAPPRTAPQSGQPVLAQAMRQNRRYGQGADARYNNMIRSNRRYSAF